MTPGSLLHGATTLVHTCAGVRAGERVLVVTDTGRPPEVAEAIALAARQAGAEVVVAVMAQVPTGHEPPAAVAAAMTASDVILAPVSGSLFHTDAARRAAAAGARLMSVTEATGEILSSGGCMADFAALVPTVERVRDALTAASEVHVTAPGGTDLRLSLAGREAMMVTGLARDPGIRTGWPDIEAFIAPREGSANGVVVIDASASNIGLVESPIRMEIRDGMVTSVTGGAQADEIARGLAAASHPGAYAIAELGIGLNPSALVRGHIIEDEGAYGTAHIALGNNTNFTGGENWAPIHFDFVFFTPTIRLDGANLMTDGRLDGVTIGPG